MSDDGAREMSLSADVEREMSADVEREMFADVEREMSADVEREMSADADMAEVTVMVAGKCHQGKSTALNNIFGLSLEARLSSESTTQDVIITSVKQNGIPLKVVDIPGLEALDIDTKAVLAKLKKQKIDKQRLTLLYCLSVAPSSSPSKLDLKIVKLIQNIFGESVWKRCLLVLTFSDTAVRENFENIVDNDTHVIGYLAHLRGYAEKFHEILRTCDAKVPGVMILFDYEKGQNDRKLDKLMAVPASKHKCMSDGLNTLPGILTYNDPKNWTDFVFNEILKMIKDDERALYIQMKYGIWQSAAGGGVAGGIVGGAVGVAAATKVGAGVAGYMGAKAVALTATAATAGPLVAGAAVGAGVACVGALSAAAAWKLIEEYKEKNNVKLKKN